MYCDYFDNRDYFCRVVFFYCFRLWLRFGGYAGTYAGDVGKSGGYFCAAVEFGPADDYYVQGARRL